MEDITCNWYWKPVSYTGDIFHATKIDEELSYVFSLVNVELICLGETETVKTGAARLKSDDADWRHKIKELQEHATGIIVCLGSSEGLVEEIKNIYNDRPLSEKTVFIMLPEESVLIQRILWIHAQKELKPFGIILPEYRNVGLLFNNKGYSQPLLGYHCKSPIDLAKAFLDVLEKAPG